jgi:hypothetical protein
LKPTNHSTHQQLGADPAHRCRAVRHVVWLLGPHKCLEPWPIRGRGKRQARRGKALLATALFDRLLK